MRYWLFIVLIFLVLQPIVYAEINNPSAVSTMVSEITQKGTILVSGSVAEMEYNISIPQDDEYQNVKILSVSSDYSVVEDKYGNQILNIKTRNPESVVEYEVKTRVTSERRNSFKINKHSDFLDSTPLIEVNASSVSELASTFTGNTFEKTANMAKWINENIEYDTTYVAVNESASSTLGSRKGTCDEFSILMLSMTRNLGMHSAYIAGYAYTLNNGEGKFVPHGWVEIHEEDGIQFDPTWSEGGYLDGAHVKFATLSDGIFKELQVGASGYGVFKISIEDVETNIEVIDSEESEFIKSTTIMLENNVWNGYAVTKTDLFYDGCILTKIKAESCKRNGDDFLKPLNKEKPIFFCNSKTDFSVFQIPENLEMLSTYTCPISLIIYSGTENVANLKLSTGLSGKTELILDKENIIAGDTIEAMSTGSHIFTSEGDYGYNRLVFTAPEESFDVYSYSNGALDTKHVEISLIRALDVSIISEDIVEYGNSLDFQVKVSNLLPDARRITVRYGDQTLSKKITDYEYFDFQFEPEIPTDNIIRVYADSGGYTVSSTKMIFVKQQAVQGFFAKIKSLLNNLFGFL